MKTQTTTAIDNLCARIGEDCTAIDIDARYDEAIDECYSFESVGGIFAHMLPSRVLKECDEVAYRCGKNDWLDSEGYIELDNGHYAQDDVEAVRDALVEEMEAEQTELEAELVELEESDAENDAEILAKSTEISLLVEAIKAVRNYSF